MATMNLLLILRKESKQRKREKVTGYMNINKENDATIFFSNCAIK
jgi:hypothetical protein